MQSDDASNIPIDIHYNKLVDWLIDRRHCTRQWPSSALVIREKINNAIQDMPAVEEITQLLQGTYINYFHCLRIVELLKDTEKGSKNIFGMYSSQRMKDWQEIVKLYQKDGVNIAEASQMLARNVNYEIPALKRQIEKCDKAQQDCIKKEQDYLSGAAEQRARYQKSCKDIGIKGDKVKSELIALAKDLPSALSEIATSTQDLTPAIDYYTAFINFTHNSPCSEYCKMVKYVQEHGNVTTYEWRTGKKPTSVEEVLVDVPDEEDVAGEVTDEIDFDIGDESGIDFGISLDDPGIELSAEGGGDIDWGNGAEMDGETAVISLSDQSNGDQGIACGTDALSLIDNPKTRNLLIDDLFELEAFLRQRQSDLEKGDDVLTSSSFQNAPPSLQINTEEVRNMLQNVQEILNRVNNERMQQLLQLRSSPRYVERLTEQLRSIMDSAEKMQAMKGLMVLRAEESQEERQATQPKINIIREKTRELKKQVEQEISQKYKNRPVNIMGEINTI